jgi:putative oxidoreductase
MRSTVLLGARAVVGGYLAIHGAQKLFGAFGGPGLTKAAAGFERIGLAPGRQMAALAGAAELGGGLLTVAGAADPAGPLAIIGTMAVASATHQADIPRRSSPGSARLTASGPASAAPACAGTTPPPKASSPP